MKVSWTPALINRLRTLYATNTSVKCAEILGIPFTTIKSALKIHKISGRGMMTFWTAERKEQLTKLYPETRNIDLAEMFGCKEAAIGSQAFKLRLRKTKEFMLRCSSATAFKKGQVSHNKGQKMSPELYEKVKHTMFKKGNIPANAKAADGATSIRADNRGVQYRFIRVTIGNWISHSRYVWEQANGPIPAGMCVWHKDYDTLNDELGNLEMITRKENRLRNAGHAKMDDKYIMQILSIRKSPEFKAAIMANPDLIEIKRLQIQLNRALKEQQNDTENNQGS